MTLVTLGKKSAAELDNIIDETFSSIPGTPKQLTPYAYELPERSECTQIIPAPGLTTCVVQHTIRAGQPDLSKVPALHVLCDTMAGNKTSILEQEIRVRRGQAYSFSATQHHGRPEMNITIRYGCDKQYLEDGPTQKGNPTIVREALERIATDPLPIEFVRQMRRISADDFKNRVDNPDECCEWYGGNSAIGDFIDHREFIRKLRSVTPRQIRDAAREWLPGMVTAVFVPEKR
jgi:predicted Zn-dependent peptidase